MQNNLSHIVKSGVQLDSPKKPLLILGLDPGTVKIGFALLALQGPEPSFLDMGVLKAKAQEPLEQRLLTLGQALEKLYQKHLVSETALERVFLGKNPDSAFKLGQAFGLCAYQAVRHGSGVCSYPARYVKQVVTGSGRADKEMVKNFVLNTFGLGLKKEEVENDATDALAVAFCHWRMVSLPNKARNIKL